jgi:hypothetical protein
MKNIIRTIKEWSKLLKYPYCPKNNRRFYTFLNGLDNQTKFDYMYLTTPWHQAVIDAEYQRVKAEVIKNYETNIKQTIDELQSLIFGSQKNERKSKVN